MSKSNATEVLARLTAAGIGYEDAAALRRVSMTLHAWHEGECGTDRGAIERDEATGRTYWVNSYTGRRSRIPDRESGALRRLAGIMARYPGFLAYVQGDPRGCALYILRPGDVKPGDDVDSVYSRGLPVYK